MEQQNNNGSSSAFELFFKNRSKTVKIQSIQSLIEGIFYGFLVMSEVVLRREMHASKLLITLFTMVMPISSLFSLYFSHYITKYPASIKKFIVIAALTTRLPLLLFPLMPTAYGFLLFAVIYYVGFSFIKPIQSLFMKANYHKNELGKLFGYMTSINKIAFIISIFAFGKMMDSDSSSYVMLFTFGAFLSFTSMMLSALIPFDKWQQSDGQTHRFDPVIFRTLFRVFKASPLYFIYETAFFIYGGGFMVISAAIPILLVDYLHLSYATISTGRGFFTAVVLVVLTPLFGKWFDKTSPPAMGKYVFLLLALYPFSMLLSYCVPQQWSVAAVYTAFFFFGVGMSGVTILWNMGPLFFVKKESDSAELTAVHVTMTGLRGLIMPPLGFLLMKIHILAPFVASILFMFSAAVVMLILEKRTSAHGKQGVSTAS